MRTRVTTLLLLAVGLLTASLLPLAPGLAQSPRLSTPVAVIVSAQSDMRDISSAFLRRIFLGEPSEFQGQRLVPLNYAPSDPLRVAFDRAALNLGPEQAGRYWVDRRIRGQGLPPRAISGQKLLRNVVARLAGAVGYVTPDQLDESVRALTIDGKSYTDRGYPLQLGAP
jgi:hypothetical protein